MPDSKRVSSYDSLSRTSDEFTKLPNTYNSLFTGLTSHENSMISSSENSSGMISSPHNLSHLSNRLSEFNQKQKSFLSFLYMLKTKKILIWTLILYALFIQ